MSTENAAEKENLAGIIKPGTTLIIDFEFEDGEKTRRVVTIPERQGKNNATGSEGNSDSGLRKTLFQPHVRRLYLYKTRSRKPMSQASETIQGQVSYTSHSGVEYFLTNDSGDYKIHHRDVRRLNLSPESAGLSIKGTPKITESLNWIETGTAQINL